MCLQKSPITIRVLHNQIKLNQGQRVKNYQTIFVIVACHINAEQINAMSLRTAVEDGLSYMHQH